MKKKIFMGIGVALCLIGGSSLTAEENKNIPKLMVRGESKLFKPADQLEISISVVTQDPDSKTAVQANNKKMRQVVDQLSESGLAQGEYQTGRFHIQPIYHYPDSKSDKGPTITHYEVTNTIQVKTKKLELAEKIIGATVQAGANRLDQISFSLSDPQMYRDEAIQVAAKHAIADANSLAQAAQVKLIRILSLELDQTQNHYPAPLMMMANKSHSESYETPIEAGDVELNASVKMTFEIGPQK